MAAPEPGSGGEITRCEWCGTEYPADAPPTRAEPPPRRAPMPPSPRGGEPETHCEWCGAPYPVQNDA
jgi:redox-regulated HSP33 family molecular chaperone